MDKNFNNWHENVQKVCIACREGGKGGSRWCFTENKTVLSQFMKNRIGIFRFMEKNENDAKRKPSSSLCISWMPASSSTAKPSESLSEESPSYLESWSSCGSLNVAAPSRPSSFKILVVLFFQLVQTLAVLPGEQQSDTCSEEEC